MQTLERDAASAPSAPARLDRSGRIAVVGRGLLRHPANRVLVVILAVSLMLRIALSAAMWPTYFDTGDVWQQVVAAEGRLFGNPIGPAGYPMFLRLLRPVSASIALPVVVQHVLGMVSVIALYDATVRLKVSRWLALLPAAVVGLSLDQVYVEHFLMTDALFGALLAIGFWLVVRAQDGRRTSWWLAACGGTVGAATTVRFAGLPMVVLTTAAAAILASGSLGRRVTTGALVLAGALTVLVPYHIALYVDQERLNPSASSGWILYARAAPFADCTKFDPPPGTAFLCETSDPDERPGFDFYLWEGGPARTAYSDHRYGNRELRAFAEAAIAAEPLEYVKAVTQGVARYYVPIGPARTVRDGVPMATIDSDPPDVAYEKGIEETYERYYDNTAPTRRPRLLNLLGHLQPFLRMGTPLMLASVLAAAIGLVCLRGRSRIWILYAAGATTAIIVMSALAVGYVWRYAVPVLPLGAVAVVVAISGLMERRNQQAVVPG